MQALKSTEALLRDVTSTCMTSIVVFSHWEAICPPTSYKPVQIEATPWFTAPNPFFGLFI